MNMVGKVAVVTGGNSGLGRAVVEHFLTLGVKVAVFDINPPDNEENIRQYTVDVTHESDVSAALDDVVDHFGALHICVNCAGIAPAKKILDRDNVAMPIQNFKQVVDINLVGTFSMCALAAEKMAMNHVDEDISERGIIINTASIAAYEGQKGQCAYAASKGAIASLTLPMARDLKSNAIRVVAIAPGVMGTPMLMAMPDSVQESLVANIPFPKRLGFPQEFASLVAHVIDNSYINGEVIRLDGALRMQ